MADSPLDQLLLEMGIDLSPVQKAGEQIKSILTDLNAASDKVIDKTKEQTSAQTTNISQMRQLADDAVQAAIQAISSEKEKQAVLETQTAEFNKQAAAQEVLSAGAQQLASDQLLIKSILEAQTAELEKQSAEQRKKNEEEKGKKEGGGFGDIASGVATKLGGALLGPGIGGLIGAVTGGELVAHGIEQVTEAIAKFIEKTEEAILESGALVQVMDRFNKLAAGAGIDGAKFLDDLNVATEGLVDKFTLAQFGARALQSGIKNLTPEKISEVTEAVVKLAESSGHTAKQGVDALGTALARGGTSAGRMLANITGLTHGELELANLSPLLNRTQRDTESLTHAFAVLIAEAARLGEVPRTLDQATQQWAVVKKDLFLSFGQGVNESAGTQAFLKFFTSFTRNIEQASDKARDFGDKLGEAFVLLTPLLNIAKEALDLILDQLDTLATAFTKLGNSTDSDKIVGSIRLIGHALLLLKPIVDGLILQFSFMAKVLLGMGQIMTPTSGYKPEDDTRAKRSASASARVKGGLQTIAGAFQDLGPGGAGDKSTQQTQELKDKFDKMMDEIDFELQDEKRLGKPPTKKVKQGEQDDTDLHNQEQALELEKKYATAEAALKEATDAKDLERKKTQIAVLQRLDQDGYQAGIVSLQKHLDTQKALAQQSYTNEIARINADLEAKRVALEQEQDINQKKVKMSPQLMTPEQAQAENAVAIVTQAKNAENAQKDREKANADLHTKLYDIDNKGNAARYAEQHKAITDRLSLVEDGVKAEEALNKQLYEQGAISADQYIQSQMAGIQKLTAAKLQASDDTIAKAKATQKYTLELGQAEAAANVKTVQDSIQQLKALQEQVTSLRLGDITRQYGDQNKGLENTIGLQTSQPSVAFQTSTASLIQRLQANLNTEVQKLVALASDPTSQLDPKAWFQIYEQIQSITEQQLKWNQALREQLDMMKQVGTGLGSIGGAIQANFQSKFAQSLATNIQTGAKGLEQSFKTADIFKGTTAVTPDQKMQAMADKMSAAGKTVTTTYTNEVTAIQAVINGLNALAAKLIQITQQGQPDNGDTDDDTNEQSDSEQVNSQLPMTSTSVPGGGMPASVTNPDPSGKLQQFTTKLGAAVTQVDSFTQSILHSKNALTGAAGGAVGGAGLGNSIPGLPPGIGALLGAGAGALLGGIVGQKNAQMTANLTNFTDQYKSIMNQFALNTNNLNDTITQLSGLVTQIQAMQSSSKKGSAQYQQLIDQYDDQIQQLEQQQNQIIINMNEMSAVMSAPLGQQSALSGIQSILQQYEQYAGAIQSVTQLMKQGQTQQEAQTTVNNQTAAAYQYLVGAMQAYEQNLVNQLNQDEQQAIQTALQLNDLLYQRQQMMLQYNDQVESVLSAGVLTRQLTRAQTAGQQIENLTVQYNMQMDAINEQISADQYSVSVASTIFSLAQTRIGLENQLLTAQNYQTTQSMAQIASLQQLVNQIQSGNFQSGALGLLVGAMPGTTNGGVTMTPLEILQTFAGLISANPGVYAAVLASASTGTSASSTSAKVADAVFSGAYQSRASMGYAQYRGTNIQG